MSTAGGQSEQRIGLGSHSARGMVYLFASTAAMKVVAFVAQVILGYLLSDKDFGVYAKVLAVTAFIQVIEQAGVGDVLVQRKRLRPWAVPAFWLAATLGLLSCLLIAAIAPVASRMYDDRRVLWALLILAPASIPNALAVVPRAQLARELRFRALALINFIGLVIRLGLTIVLATRGFGPYSFVWPVLVSNAAVAAILWQWGRVPWSLDLQFHKWRYLIGDSIRILVAELQRSFLEQSDNLLLGLFRTTQETGIYAYGFNFSIQILQLLAFNLMNVLFPALKKLNDQPEAQFRGFMKAQRILAVVGISSCLLQAATSGPLTYLLLDPQWIASIGVMQILSVGTALRMVGGSSYALLKSQGRFRAILWNRWGFVALQVIGLLLVLSLGGGILAVATVVAVVSTIIGPVTFYTAVLPYGAGWRAVGEVLFRPAVCGVVSVGTAWLLAMEMAARGIGPLPQLLVTVVVAAALNLLLAWLWMRPVWDDFWFRIWRLLPQRTVAQAN